MSANNVPLYEKMDNYMPMISYVVGINAKLIYRNAFINQRMRCMNIIDSNVIILLVKHVHNCIAKAIFASYLIEVFVHAYIKVKKFNETSNDNSIVC